jgi:D-proline reductase (dithiol) PrdB
MSLRRFRNRVVAKVLTRVPRLAAVFTRAYTPRESGDIPWTPVTKPLRECKVAIVTTAGVHRGDQKPFDMTDSKGDPTFREIDGVSGVEDLMITHDYYDHADADRDINVVFPIERLRELGQKGIVGTVAETHYGFMGHIDGPHIHTLVDVTAPDAANRLMADNVDIVLVTPG